MAKRTKATTKKKNMVVMDDDAPVRRVPKPGQTKTKPKVYRLKKGSFMTLGGKRHITAGIVFVESEVLPSRLAELQDKDLVEVLTTEHKGTFTK